MTYVSERAPEVIEVTSTFSPSPGGRLASMRSVGMLMPAFIIDIGVGNAGAVELGLEDGSEHGAP